MTKAFILFALLASPQQDPVRDPSSGWKDFAIGSWVRMKTKTTMKVGGQSTVVNAIAKSTLQGRSEARLVIETVTSTLGSSQKGKQEIPLKSPDTKGRVKYRELDRAEVELEVAGKRLKCVRIKYQVEGEKDGITTRTVTTVWTNKGIPGHVAKLAMDMTQPIVMNMEMIAEGFEVKK